MSEKTPKWSDVPRIRLGLTVVAVAAFANVPVTLWLWSIGRLDTQEMSTSVLLGCVVGVTLGGSAMSYSPGPIPEGSPSPAGKSLSWRLLSNVVLGLMWTSWGTMQAAQAFDEGSTARGVLYVGLVLAWLYLSPALLMGWTWKAPSAPPDPEAELNRAFRARATASGFWALLACGAAAYVISLWRPDILPYLLPFTLWLGGSAACIHFVWLHRQADRDLGDDG